jgi:competence transcription factor ComK
MDKQDSDLIIVADRIYKTTTELIIEGHQQFAIAAALTMVAMQIYKSSLSKEDYDKMVDSISDSRDQIMSLNDMVKNAGSFH